MTDENNFSKMIKNGIDRNVYFIFGEDGYLKKYYCDLLVDKIVPEDFRTFNLHLFEDDETPFEDIFEIAENYPMMSDRSCILLKNYDIHSLKKDNLKTFMGKLSGIPETTVIIFYYDVLEVDYGTSWKPGPWASVVDAIDKIGLAVRLNPRTTEALARMLTKNAKQRNSEISSENAEYLVSVVGTDISNLRNEFDKLCAYASGKQITREMIDDIAIKTVSADVFMICDSMFSGKYDNAFAVLNELLKNGVTSQEILGAINSTFVNMYRIKVALNNNRSFEDICNAFSFTKGQTSTSRKLLPVLKPVKISALRQCLVYLSDADEKIKRAYTGDDNVILTETIAKLGKVLRNA